MPRRTYHQQVKLQKERARKARQDEKQQRRSERIKAEEETASNGAESTPAVPVPETTS